jgi:hypothetical protein
MSEALLFFLTEALFLFCFSRNAAVQESLIIFPYRLVEISFILIFRQFNTLLNWMTKHIRHNGEGVDDQGIDSKKSATLSQNNNEHRGKK